MKWLLVPLALAQSAAWAQEDHAHHHGDNTPSLSGAQITVTINPEARVSAVLGAPLPLPAACGASTELKVRIINQGFVTAPLQASIIGDGVRYVSLQIDNTKLSGKSEDSRTIRLVPFGPSPADITIAFSLDRNVGDLGGRDRVHMLVRCTKLRPIEDGSASRS